MDALGPHLQGDPAQFQALLHTLAIEHGLRVEILADGRVKVALAIRPRALTPGDEDEDPLPELVAVAPPGLVIAGTTQTAPKTAAAWAAEENRSGRHVCAYGCGQPIRVVAVHLTKGIPTYLQGHHRASNASAVHQSKADGYVTLARPRSSWAWARTRSGGRASAACSPPRRARWCPIPAPPPA